MSRNLRGMRGRRGRGGNYSNRASTHRNILTEDRVTDLIKRTVTEIFNTRQQATAQPGEGPATRAGRRPGNGNADHQSTHPRFADNTTTRRSSNPDFARLVRESARYIKVTHAMNNWRNIPASIDRDLKKLTDSIKPPAPTDDLRDHLREAADNFRSAVTAAVQHHLEKAAELVKANTQAYNQQDISMIHDTVRRQMQRPINKKIHKTTIDKALNDLKPTPAPPRLDSSDWPTMNDNDADDVEEDDLSDLVSAIQKSNGQRTATSTPGKRKLQPSPSSMPPPKVATTSTAHHRPQPMKRSDNLLVLPPEIRNWWSLPAALPYGANVLAITDSNGSSWKPPQHISVIALRGGNIRDATRMLNSYKPPSTLKHIVMAVGTNNRRDTSDVITSELTELHTALRNINRTSSFMAIPEHPLASPQESDGADYINSTARDLFGDNFIDLAGVHIQAANNYDSAHYCQDSAQQVVARLTSSIPAAYLNA